MRITVLGGHGFLGSRTVEALSKSPNVEVQVASRRGPLVVDVNNPKTFTALKDSDMVIDLIDATSNAPDTLAAWCIEQGILFIEATSDRPAIERLAALSVSGPGLVVLGGGIFTGVSNLLAREVSNSVAPTRVLTLGISSSPYSGAGKGTVALMTSAMGLPAVKTFKGHRVETLRIEEGPRLNFPTKLRPTLHMSFAEQSMLPKSTQAATVEVYFAPKPAFLVKAFTWMPAFLLKSKLFASLMTLYFSLLRTFVLRSVSSSVELLASASGTTDRTSSVTCDDGMMAGAWALAASALMLGESRPSRSGVCFIDDVLHLVPVIQRANQLAGVDVLRWTPSQTW